MQERLTQLEIPYFQVATGRGSPKKQRFFDIMGTFQAPYLEVGPGWGGGGRS